jgi:hypothetical protein
MEQDKFQQELFSFLENNLTGVYQQQYLFSPLNSSISSRKSCYELGDVILKKFTNNYIENDFKGKSSKESSALKSFDKSPKPRDFNKNIQLKIQDWRPLDSSWELPEIDNEASPYVNKTDYYSQQFMKLLTECHIQKNLTNNLSERSDHYKSSADDRNSVFGENFMALLRYLQDFTESLNQNTWAKYDYSLTLYVLSIMTGWITAFTTIPPKYFMPLYDQHYPLTCDYVNHQIIFKHASINDPISFEWCIDELLYELSNFSDKFFLWYNDSLESVTFDSFLRERTNDIWNNFINCKEELLFLPTLHKLERSYNKDLYLGYYYCICDSFIRYQLPNIRHNLDRKE